MERGIRGKHKAKNKNLVIAIRIVEARKSNREADKIDV